MLMYVKLLSYAYENLKTFIQYSISSFMTQFLVR